MNRKLLYGITTSIYALLWTTATATIVVVTWIDVKKQLAGVQDQYCFYGKLMLSNVILYKALVVRYD